MQAQQLTDESKELVVVDMQPTDVVRVCPHLADADHVMRTTSIATEDRAHDGLSVFARMREDMYAVLDRDPSVSSAREVFFYSTGMHAIWAHRVQHWLWKRGHKTLATILSKRSRKRYGVEIHPAATIGRRVVIDHGMGIVIGATATVGDDCLIYQGVTLGMTGKHRGKRHPTIGSGVTIGANAVILGNITVGNNAKIGAGAVVVKPVPSDVTVAGVPAKIVRDRRNLDEFRHSPAKWPRLVQDSPTGKVSEKDESIVWSCGL